VILPSELFQGRTSASQEERWFATRLSLARASAVKALAKLAG
jgi:hypothetical protein